MFTIGKTRIPKIGAAVLGLLLWIGVAVVPLACLTINKQPDNPPPSQSRTDVNVGGDNGVDVKHSDSGTEVKVGGDKGVVVEHPSNQ
jgi:hypothetical protein